MLLRFVAQDAIQRRRKDNAAHRCLFAFGGRRCRPRRVRNFRGTDKVDWRRECAWGEFDDARRVDRRHRAVVRRCFHIRGRRFIRLVEFEDLDHRQIDGHRFGCVRRHHGQLGFGRQSALRFRVGLRFGRLQFRDHLADACAQRARVHGDTAIQAQRVDPAPEARLGDVVQLEHRGRDRKILLEQPVVDLLDIVGKVTEIGESHHGLPECAMNRCP